MRMRLKRDWQHLRAGDTLEAGPMMQRWLLLHALAEPVHQPQIKRKRRGPTQDPPEEQNLL